MRDSLDKGDSTATPQQRGTGHVATADAAPLALVKQLAQLLGVDAPDLQAFLSTRWTAGEEQAVRSRLSALKNEHAASASKAAAAKRLSNGRKLEDVVYEQVQHYLQEDDHCSITAACEWVATDLKRADGTIRNAYYKASKQQAKESRHHGK